MTAAKVAEAKSDLALPGKKSLFVYGTEFDDVISVKPLGTGTAGYLMTRNGGPIKSLNPGQSAMPRHSM